MSEKTAVAKTIGATEVRNNLGTLLNRVHRGEEQLVVEKLGIPVVAIISIRDYEHYRRLLAQEVHQELGRRMNQAMEEGFTEETLIAEMEQDRRTIYDELYLDK